MKEIMKKFYKKNKHLLITFGVSLIVIIAIFILKKVTPFGKHSLLAVDFYHQYGPMMGELFDRVKNGNQLLYSFSMGMGLPFFLNFFNYLSSPFNIIMFLFSKSTLLTSYSVIIGLKIVASTVTMMILLSKKFTGNKLKYIPLALLYSYSAYMAAYYWNIMWLDGMIFLPLVVLGIEKIIEEEKCMFYIISLALILWANYFMAYMICIFAVLYFIVYLVIKTDKFDIKVIIRKCLKFGISSLIAGGLCAIFLIPVFDGLRNISAANNDIPTTPYYEFSFSSFLLNHFGGVDPTILKSSYAKAPNISCGIIPIFLFLLFIINPKIKLKTKICLAALLFFIGFSFSNAFLDFMWHAFHVPNDLPFRYSYLYSFVLILISGYSLNHLKNIKFEYFIGAFALLMILTGLLYNYDTISKGMLCLNYAVLSIFLCAYMICNNLKKTKIFIIIFIVLIMGECVAKFNYIMSATQEVDIFYYDYESMETALNYLEDNDKDVYRIGRAGVPTLNDSSWYGYYGQTGFSSMNYYGFSLLQYRLGLPGNKINSYYYRNTTPVYDLMFNIKYFMGTLKDDIRYEPFYDSGSIRVKRDNSTVSLMYGVDKNISSWRYGLDNPFDNQNSYIESSTGITPIFEIVDDVEKEEFYKDNKITIIKYTVKDPDEIMYYYSTDENIKFMVMDTRLFYRDSEYANQDYIPTDSTSTYTEEHVISLKANEEDYTYYIAYKYYKDDIPIYKINSDNFNKAYEILNRNKVNITEFKEYYIKGSTTIHEDMTMYTSIPYDKGWKVLIDGIETKTYKIGDAVLGFDINKGDHTIELEYSIPYLKEGALISITSLAALIILKKRFKYL